MLFIAFTEKNTGTYLYYSSCIKRPHRVLWNGISVAWLCLCLHLLPKTCFLIKMCFDQLYQLQLGKPSWGSWGKQNSGFAIPVSIHASSLSFSLSSGNKLFFLYHETATQLVCCHTLTDFPKPYNHCDQLSSCSQMTTFI